MMEWEEGGRPFPPFFSSGSCRLTVGEGQAQVPDALVLEPGGGHAARDAVRQGGLDGRVGKKWVGWMDGWMDAASTVECAPPP